VNQYLQQTFNTRTNVYSHDAAAFATLKPRILQEAEARYHQMKRFEAEADVVGGFVCGAAGMTGEQYVSAKISALQAMIAAIGGSEIPTEPPHGTRLQIRDTSELLQYIESFAGFDAHPTNQERFRQLQIAKPLYRASSPSLVGDWSSAFNQV